MRLECCTGVVSLVDVLVVVGVSTGSSCVSEDEELWDLSLGMLGSSLSGVSCSRAAEEILLIGDSGVFFCRLFLSLLASEATTGPTLCFPELSRDMIKASSLSLAFCRVRGAGAVLFSSWRRISLAPTELER